MSPDPKVDEAAFSELAERYRPEMRVHCYRMLGSFEDSEDAVQETLLCAWRRRETFEGRSSFRAWLYRIATNACLDALGRRERAPSRDGCRGPVAAAVLRRAARGDPRRRRRAGRSGGRQGDDRARLHRRDPAPPPAPARGADPPRADASDEEQALLERYLNATDEADAEAFVEMMREDARFSMPPEPGVWVGRRTIVEYWSDALDPERFGRVRGVVTRANMQPAVACYLKRPGDDAYRPMALDVIRIEEGLVAEIVTFPPNVFPYLRLPDQP